MADDTDAASALGSRPRTRGVGLLVLTVALTLGGCSDGGGGGGEDAPGAVPASTSPSTPGGLPSADDVFGGAEVDPEDLAQLRSAYEALDEEQQREVAGEASAEVERQLYDASGLTEALGGADAAASSIAETAQWLDSLGDAYGAGRPVARVRPFASGTGGGSDGAAARYYEGVFGALVVGSLGVEAAATSAGGEEGTARLAEGATITSKGTTAELRATHTSTDSQGVTTQFDSRIAMSPCPGPDGTFRVTALLEIASTVAGGRTGKRGSFEITVSGTVGDDAELVGYDTEYRGQFSDFRASRGSFVDFTGRSNRDKSGSFVVNRTAGAAPGKLVQDTSFLAALVSLSVGSSAVKAAEKAWKSGRCVTLAPTVSDGPRGLTPSQTVTLTAAPRSKADGRPTGGTVTAVLAAGAASVTPASATADATFTYTAPAARDASGTVALESRSRRGVGKTEVVLDTRQMSYVASGGGPVTFSGRVASTTAPFEVGGSFPGGTAVFRFDGAREDGGAVRISGGGSGARLTGRGTYTISGEGVLTVTVRERSCVDVSGACRSTTHRITLTPER